MESREDSMAAQLPEIRMIRGSFPLEDVLLKTVLDVINYILCLNFKNCYFVLDLRAYWLAYKGFPVYILTGWLLCYYSAKAIVV